MILQILLIAALITLIIAQLKKADVYLALIKGFMIGILYHKEQYEDGIDEHTIQCLIGIVNLTVRWENEQTGLDL